MVFLVVMCLKNYNIWSLVEAKWTESHWSILSVLYREASQQIMAGYLPYCHFDGRNRMQTAKGRRKDGQFSVSCLVDLFLMCTM